MKASTVLETEHEPDIYFCMAKSSIEKCYIGMIYIFLQWDHYLVKTRVRNKVLLQLLQNRKPNNKYKMWMW